MYKTEDVKQKIKDGIKDEFWYTNLIVLGVGILEDCKPIKGKFYLNHYGDVRSDDFNANFMFEGGYFDTEEEAIDYYNSLIYNEIKELSADIFIKRQLKEKFINTDYIMEEMVRGVAN